LAVALAVFTYLLGLDSQHIPKNGDEYPYEQIARVTAARGHWLPLDSELPEMRNTKPPLLFWQGIVSTNWGRNWTLWHLRWPSVVYTLMTAGLVFALGWKLSGHVETGATGLLVYLAFFSTYRYGRPFLTDSPSTFWLFVPCAALVWRPALIESRALMPILLGLATGVALLYKSFALLLPVGVCLGWWCLRLRRYSITAFLARDAVKLIVLAAVSLGVFSLWFLLDPDPRAIVEKFVIGENLGKLGSPGRSYLRDLLWGGSSIWRLAVSYPLNAGLLMFPAVAVFILAFRRRAELSDGERLLWMWVLSLFIVFSLPSQRDERYLLPAMPALAIVCALNWQRIDRRAFTASLVATGAVAILMGYVSLRLEQSVSGETIYPAGYWVLLAGTLGLVSTSIRVPRLAPSTVPVAILLTLTGAAGLLRPLDGPLGTSSAEVQALAAGKTIWVPVNFAAKEEGYRFLLPGADVRPYPLDPPQTAEQLVSRYPFVAVRMPVVSASVPPGLVRGQRLDIATRHTAAQITDMALGRVFEHLFVREFLVEADGLPEAPPPDDGRGP
jgi:4-amino-4-deoxy-L-arabinose transferase-like glycosyltransferase